MKKIIIDGKEAVLGRLGTYVSKELLKGNEVAVLNSEQVIISGNKNSEKQRLWTLRNKGRGGSLKGPKYIRSEDRLLKRKIRGMLPWDKPKGREAYKRLRCFIENGPFSEDELKTKIELKTRKPREYFTIKQLLEGLK